MAQTETAPPRIAEAHDPRLYSNCKIAKRFRSLDEVGEGEIELYREQGYLAVENVFNAEEIDSAKDGLNHLIMGGNLEFNCIEFERTAAAKLDTLSLEQRQDAVRKLMYFVKFDSRLDALAQHPRLLKVVSQILDGEPAMFQDMALLKPPRIGREKPWHQDHAYFDYEMGTRIVGVWIALDEATIENGCMQVMAGAHRQGPQLHFQRRDWQICDTNVLGKQSTAVPLKPGGALFFDGLVPHGTPANQSDSRRRAVQFHYCRADAKSVKTEQRLAIFGSEGKNVSC